MIKSSLPICTPLLLRAFNASHGLGSAQMNEMLLAVPEKSAQLQNFIDNSLQMKLLSQKTDKSMLSFNISLKEDIFTTYPTVNNEFICALYMD